MNTTRHEKELRFFCKGIFLLALVGILLLNGCMTTKTSGVKMDPEKLDQIKIGQTTRAEVEALLGKPILTRKSKGLIALGYFYHQFETRQMMPPILVGIGPFIVAEALAGKSHMGTEDTIILIDKDGKVVDIKRMSGDYHITGLFVKDDSPKEDITKANLIQPGITTQEQAKDILGAPPFLTRLQSSTNQIHLHYRGSGEIKALIVVIHQDGIVDEVKEYFKGARFKRVDTNSIAQIKELISSREAVESILDNPSGISHTPRGDFYIYGIQEGGTKKELYVQYEGNGLVTSLTLKVAF